jgi:hypothetical protein
MLYKTRLWTTGVRFPTGAGKEFFCFATESRPTLRPAQSPIQQVPGDLSPGITGPGSAADNSPPSSAEIKNVWSCISAPQYVPKLSNGYVFVAWCLVKLRDNFTVLYCEYNENSRLKTGAQPTPETSCTSSIPHTADNVQHNTDKTNQSLSQTLQSMYSVHSHIYDA